MIAAIALAATLQGAQVPVPTLPPPPVVSHHVTVLREWVRAVERHTPGEVDAAALWPTTLTRDEVGQLWVDVRALIAYITDPRAKEFFVRPAGERSRLVRVFTTPQDVAALRKLALDIKQGIGAQQFYKRAAVLHSDVVMLVQRGPAIGALEGSFLGPRRTVVRTEDGQQTGLYGSDVNWEFGRMLLDEVREPSKDHTVRAWYAATMSHKLGEEELDFPHFERAGQLLPDEAEIQFLFGALHEAFSDPRVQTVLETVVMPLGIRLGVQPERVELGDAERYLARALRIDPTHVEARVRRGRVLGRLGRHKEAVEELRRAIATSRDTLLTYYAQLFVGGSEEALGRYDAARSAYEQARALYTQAQAPVLASSQLLHRSGDRPAAHTGLRDVLQPADTKTADDDPWWSYHLAAGRFTAERVAALYRSLNAAPLQ